MQGRRVNFLRLLGMDGMYFICGELQVFPLLQGVLKIQVGFQWVGGFLRLLSLV